MERKIIGPITIMITITIMIMIILIGLITMKQLEHTVYSYARVDFIAAK